MHVLDRKTAAVKFRTTALLSAPTAAHTAASMDALERKMHAVHSTLLSDDFFARKLPGALTTSMAMFDRFLSSPLVVRLWLSSCLDDLSWLEVVLLLQLPARPWLPTPSLFPSPCFGSGDAGGAMSSQLASCSSCTSSKRPAPPPSSPPPPRL
ncbi:hypothetical protein DYB37_002067 [Aphanomyces astaci]|uniref:Uncharacterized protein n=2 Tax=Aphanomyces astaci TaxID=112090 RepID=A0A3R6WR74_APHAT|nr:hypothetical protein DYB35_006952 [Aphanomyces astaci]RHZ11262.1 hypothetical protein DYB37_002067 [Aphanomyces astaci]RHZ41151.1 hypothetical protein DYB26_013442 [Aphanomyces astaci]